MKIHVYYEDKNHAITLDVSDEECEIWIENGNHNSQTKLLNHYDGYINASSTVIEVRSDSTERYCVGEVIKSESPTSCTEFVACRTLLF